MQGLSQKVHVLLAIGKGGRGHGAGLLGRSGLKVAHRVILYRVAHLDRMAANLAVFHIDLASYRHAKKYCDRKVDACSGTIYRGPQLRRVDHARSFSHVERASESRDIAQTGRLPISPLELYRWPWRMRSARSAPSFCGRLGRHLSKCMTSPQRTD